ncbi:MAG: hypothetical protein E7L06_08315 [Schaalia turicensis]|nr:hypothetical protein [Schaalia turicensis]
MSTELSREFSTAKKQHQCSLCTAYIHAGAVYEHATFTHNGQAYEFIICRDCIVDQILGHAADYWGHSGGDGLNSDDAYAWALDRTSYPDGVPADEIAAAWRLIDRHLAAIQSVGNPDKIEPVKNPSTFGGEA